MLTGDTNAQTSTLTDFVDSDPFLNNISQSADFQNQNYFDKHFTVENVIPAFKIV